MPRRAALTPNIPTLDAVVCPLARVERADPPPDQKGLYAATHALSLAETSSPSEVLSAFLEMVRPRLGRASYRLLEPVASSAIDWAEEHYNPGRGPFVPWALQALRRAYGKLLRKIGITALRREWDDERLRDAAGHDQRALAAYLEHVAVRIRKLISTFPAHWHVPGMSPSELIRTLQVELLACVRGNQVNGIPAFDELEKAGREASIRLCARLKNRYRRRTKFYEALPAEDLLTPRSEWSGTTSTVEDTLVKRELEDALPEVTDRVRQQLSCINRGWLKAFEEDVRENEELNLARVADTMKRHRASASRAWKEISEQLRAHLAPYR